MVYGLWDRKRDFLCVLGSIMALKWGIIPRWAGLCTYTVAGAVEAVWVVHGHGTVVQRF